MVFRLLGNIGSCCIVNDPTKHAHGFQQPCNLLSHPIQGGMRPMASAVWSGHLHFGLVVMPVRLLVAARTKTTRFRRLYRKPVKGSTSVSSFPSSSHDLEDRNPDLNEGIAKTQSRAEDVNPQRAAEHQYSAVRQ